MKIRGVELKVGVTRMLLHGNVHTLKGIKDICQTEDFGWGAFCDWELDCSTKAWTVWDKEPAPSYSLYNQEDNEDKNETFNWSNKHYDNWYTFTEEDKTLGKIKIDAYFVNKMWKLNEKDDTGGLFHSLKTIARFGDKNPIERELKALYNQTKRMAELYEVKLEED